LFKKLKGAGLNFDPLTGSTGLPQASSG